MCIGWGGDFINILELIGNTPLIALKNFKKSNKLKAQIYAKIEYSNPFGSIKDRAALNVIEVEENNGKISSGSCIIEATSGNMGIALAGICKIKRYSCKIILPENMSEARKKLIKHYGAELILTPAELGMQGALKIADKLAMQSPKFFYIDQFNNLNCIYAHQNTTAPEIYQQMNGKIDVIVAGIGTGATVIGLSKYFKAINPYTEIIGVLPSSFPHTIQGIGAGFDPPFFRDNSAVDKIIYVDSSEAALEKKNIFLNEGLFVGYSSGAVIAGLKKLLRTNEYENKNIVLIFADGGDRYENSR